MNQKERLNYLIDTLVDENPNITISPPDSLEDKRIVLRSLMNIRIPIPIDSSTLEIQDAYLKDRNKERGIVEMNEIPIRDEENKISIYQGDITCLKVDAIVNAANEEMLGCFIPMHTCIDNCIHTYAGMELRQECDRQMKELRKKYGNDYVQPTALPMVTNGYNLPCKKIIHIVGPIVTRFVTKENQEQLRKCYWNILETCKKNDFKTVAICCISTGVFHFPNKLACSIAIRTVKEWIEKNPNTMERVIFNVFKEEDRRYYEEQLG